MVIGHSMGGVVALELAMRRPEMPAAVVLLDAPIVVPPELRALSGQLAPAFRSLGYREAQRGFVEGALFAPTDNPLRKAQIVEATCSTPQHVLASAYEQMFAWDGAAAARACRVPVLNLSTPLSPNDNALFTELCPQVVHGQTVGSGHFNQLEVPDQVNAMIDRFRTVGVPRPTAST